MCIPTGAKIDISINHYDNNARYQIRGASLIITEFKFRAPVTTPVLGNHKATPYIIPKYRSHEAYSKYFKTVNRQKILRVSVLSTLQCH